MLIYFNLDLNKQKLYLNLSNITFKNFIQILILISFVGFVPVLIFKNELYTSSGLPFSFIMSVRSK